MRKERLALVFATTLAVAVSAVMWTADVTAQELPLLVDVVGIEGFTLEYVLTNDTSKTAMAWAVDFVKTDSLGATIRGGQTTDNYVVTATSHLDPHARRHLLGPKESLRLKASAGVSPGASLLRVEARVIRHYSAICALPRPMAVGRKTSRITG